jgi:hypothetical protein
MRRATRAAVLLLALVALAAPGAAIGQAEGPRALWEAYPLDQATTTPEAAPATPPAARTPAPAAAPGESGDGGIPIWAILAAALGVVVLGGGIAIFAVARLRGGRAPAEARRPGPARETAPVAPPAPAPDPTPVAAAVAVSAPPAPVAREETPAAAPTPPEPPPVVPTAVEADAEAVATADDLELAELAAEYLWTVATGSRRPVVDLAARRFVRVGRTREMLGRARARGILTGAGRGRSGGALTEKGRRLLEEGSRSMGAPAWQEGVLPPVVATPETAPPGPPRLRVADEGEVGRDPGGSPPGPGLTPGEGEALERHPFTVLEGGGRPR